ncbi:hypothetical protein GCM10010172_77060 [Paractinoplanes ferrugineus]|uniref:Methyltransferase type 11 domain-containing protein n=1 Tax=Paractinoplanes ferrugineus TaxID=113564 RepID=A0A919MHM1_9ACTN|nr:class I SAM-dependent methyltransferase [Actinoplanes ferrugineus]GIE12780.1 hypothetical protein Afe05nite_46200 [Actinoplanes ferrugineus]
MTALDLADESLTGLLAWFSLIHIPDDEVRTVLAEFHRVLRPGGALLLAIKAGDSVHHKTEGYGGHPMNLHVHRRRPAAVVARLTEAGFTAEAELLHHPEPDTTGAFLFARR